MVETTQAASHWMYEMKRRNSKVRILKVTQPVIYNKVIPSGTDYLECVMIPAIRNLMSAHE